MSHSYDVRVWNLQRLTGRRGRTTYGVRWAVEGVRFRATFATRALAESQRADLLAAARKGDAFDTETGRPVAWDRALDERSWYDFALEYTDLKWKDSAATSRRSRAEALMSITTALLPSRRGRPAGRVLRDALRKWAFNTARRDLDKPREAEDALAWVSRNAPPLSVLARPQTLRAVLDTLGIKLDGTPAAPTVFARKRMVLSNALNYAVELHLLPTNPLATVKIARPTDNSRDTVDRRVVLNPDQAAALLDAVAQVQRSGPRLVAFFGLLYYAALRPEEAVNLREHDLTLTDTGWGALHLTGAAPNAGTAWTDSGQSRDQRRLKHRPHDAARRVPCSPQLATLLRRHLDEHGTNPAGHLFRGERGGALDSSTYQRIWTKTRKIALGDAASSMLARRAYDLRHAAVSTWLNAGVPPTQVATWAGHSVAVLLRTYAACLDNTEQVAQQRIDALMNPHQHGPVPPAALAVQSADDGPRQ